MHLECRGDRVRIEAATVAAFSVIVFFREGVAAQQTELPGVWNTNLSVASGTGAQEWVQFSEDGSYNRLVFLPRPVEEGPGACQISTGRWSAVPSGNSLIVTYTIEDYQPKQCLKTPGTPFVGCEPPPSDYQKTMQVRMVFAGPAALTQYSHDGSSFAFTRADALPAIPRECYDAPQ
jgi:hypothetical protein